jgi:hypothetical protein
MENAFVHKNENQDFRQYSSPFSIIQVAMERAW